jgi:DNA invertase Pin-like site-specific DNA recombinase
VRAFLYARVSTKDKGQETENQLVDMRRFVERQAWTLEFEYIDHETGSTDEREQLKAMLLACSQRKADVVVFWALDRLTREGALPTLQYLNRLSGWGVGFRSYTEPYLDSCGMFKDVIIAMLATLAKQERQRMSERVIAGLRTARERGSRLGRPRVGNVAELTTLRAQGLSIREIADRVGISPTAVARKLKSAQKAVPKTHAKMRSQSAHE